MLDFFQHGISCSCYFIQYKAREIGKPIPVQRIRSNLHDTRMGEVGAFEFGGLVLQENFPISMRERILFQILVTRVTYSRWKLAGNS